MKYKTKILKISNVTHDVKKFVVEKPLNYKFVPGQATFVSINQGSWKYEERPFTFTSLNTEPNLEFVIKRYSEHNGVTKKLHELKEGDEIIIGDPFGAISYKGKGVFIAGGAGITPFIAIFRMLSKENKMNDNVLIFSNKTVKDIILEKEFRKMFKNNPENLILTLTQENKPGYETRKIDEAFLKEKIQDFKQNFYLCGPPSMVKNMKDILKNSGAKTDSVVFEK